MRALRSFGAFWYDFVIGDDWHVAALVVAALALTALLVHVAGVNTWWLVPLAAFAALAWSLYRATSGKPLEANEPRGSLGSNEVNPGVHLVRAKRPRPGSG
jgi:hypothetical protein